MALRVAVLATGGTIATRTDGSGTAVARASGRRPMTLQHLQRLAVRVDERLRDDVAGPHRPALLSVHADAVRAASTDCGPDDSAT